MWLKRPRVRSTGHLRWISSLPCVSCLAEGPCDPSHVRIGQTGATGRKPPDNLVVPLCHACHNRSHIGHGEKAFWARLQCDPARIAGALWAVSGDTALGRRIIEIAIIQRSGLFGDR